MGSANSRIRQHMVYTGSRSALSEWDGLPMKDKFNKYTVYQDSTSQGSTVFLNPDHIVSAVMRQNDWKSRWEATLTDTSGKTYVISHPDYTALMHIILNGQDDLRI